MSLSVSIVFADGTPLGAGVNLQLLSGGAVVSTGTTDARGAVTFDVDPATLTSPAINLAPQQSAPATTKKTGTKGSKTKKATAKKTATAKR